MQPPHSHHSPYAAHPPPPTLQHHQPPPGAHMAHQQHSQHYSGGMHPPPLSHLPISGYPDPGGYPGGGPPPQQPGPYGGPPQQGAMSYAMQQQQHLPPSSHPHQGLHQQHGGPPPGAYGQHQQCHDSFSSGQAVGTAFGMDGGMMQQQHGQGQQQQQFHYEVSTVVSGMSAGGEVRHCAAPLHRLLTLARLTEYLSLVTISSHLCCSLRRRICARASLRAGDIRGRGCRALRSSRREQQAPPHGRPQGRPQHIQGAPPAWLPHSQATLPPRIFDHSGACSLGRLSRSLAAAACSTHSSAA